MILFRVSAPARALLRVLLAVVLAAGSLAVATTRAAHAAPAAPAAATAPTTRDAELTSDGAWCWFQDPRAVHYRGTFDRTYVGYVTSAGDIDVLAQDTGTGHLTQSVLHAGLQSDDHAAPGLLVLQDRRIAVFYSAHGGPYMYYRVSVNPEDITSFGPERRTTATPATGTGFTYANPFYLAPENRYYLFYRGSDFHPQMIWSSDLVTWSAPQEVVEPEDNSAATRPYVKYATNAANDTVALSLTDAHPRDNRTNSVYSVLFRHGALYAPDGTLLSVLDPTDPTAPTGTGLPTGPVSTQDLKAAPDTAHGTLVYDGASATGEAWTISEAIDSAGKPAMLFATYAGTSNTDAYYRYARWINGGWRITALEDGGGTIAPGTEEDQYVGGGDIVQTDVNTLYLSREINPGDGQWELERWTSADNGATFTHTPLTVGSVFKNVRPVVPWGPAGPVQVLWMSGTYINFTPTLYHTALREYTTDPAPLTASITSDLATIVRRNRVVISTQVVQGLGGDAVPGLPVQLVATTGGVSSVVGHANVTSSGGAQFSVAPGLDTTYRLDVPAYGSFSSTSSPDLPVHVVQPQQVSLSATPYRLTYGTATRFSGIIRNAVSGTRTAGAHVGLLRRSPDGSWHTVAAAVADANGVITVTLKPPSTAAWQIRYYGSSVNGAATSTDVTVTVLPRPAARHASAHPRPALV